MGVYSKYEDKYPNGEITQPIINVFVCKTDVKTAPNPNDEETTELKFFDLEEAPLLYNQQQRDAFVDFLEGMRGTFR